MYVSVVTPYMSVHGQTAIFLLSASPRDVCMYKYLYDIYALLERSYLFSYSHALS